MNIEHELSDESIEEHLDACIASLDDGDLYQKALVTFKEPTVIHTLITCCVDNRGAPSMKQFNRDDFNVSARFLPGAMLRVVTRRGGEREDVDQAFTWFWDPQYAMWHEFDANPYRRSCVIAPDVDHAVGVVKADERLLRLGRKDFATWLAHEAVRYFSHKVLGDHKDRERVRHALEFIGLMFQKNGDEDVLWLKAAEVIGSETVEGVKADERARMLLLSFLAGEKQLYREDDDPDRLT